MSALEFSGFHVRGRIFLESWGVPSAKAVICIRDALIGDKETIQHDGRIFTVRNTGNGNVSVKVG